MQAPGGGRRATARDARSRAEIAVAKRPDGIPAALVPLAGMLRPGSAGSNTAADHLAVLDAAIAALPPGFRGS